MQMVSGCGKRINCDEYPTATMTFLAWFSARGSQWQLCYRLRWVQVSHHPCLPWGRAKAAVSLPDTLFRQCKRALNEHKCKFSLPKSPFTVPHQCKGSFSRNKMLVLNVVNRSVLPSIKTLKTTSCDYSRKLSIYNIRARDDGEFPHHWMFERRVTPFQPGLCWRPPQPQTAVPHGTVRFPFTQKHLGRRGWTHEGENNFLQTPSRAGDRKTENSQHESKDQW